MGKINKALNRSNFKNAGRGGRFGGDRFGGGSHCSFFGNQNRQQQQFMAREQNREEKKELKLINLSEEQASRKDLKFVYKLPQNTKDVKKLLKEKSDEDKLVIVQRVRDYYNPILEPQHTDTFKQFVVCLISYYLQKDPESEVLKNHLKELCSQFGGLFSAFLKSKLAKILSIIKELKDSDSLAGTSTLEDLDKLLTQIIECQVVVLNILESPNNSKLLEILEQITGHIYQLSRLFISQSSDLLIQIVQNDIKISTRLHKKFNPAITMILLKLLSESPRSDHFLESVQKLASRHFSKNLSILPSSQILTTELAKQPNGKKLFRSATPLPALTHLRLQSKKPKELPSFNPFIDEEFMAAVLDDKKFKKKETDKDVKRKTKKAEKDALRELRKDTVQIQVQKSKEMQHRATNFKKSIIRAGNVKDDA